MRIKLFFPITVRILTGKIERCLCELPYGLGVLASFVRQNNIIVDLQDLDAELRSPYSLLKRNGISKKAARHYNSQLKAGHYTGISNTGNNLLADDLLSLTNVKGYDLIGISISSGAQILTSLLLAEKIKKEYNIPIVIGGPYVTAFAHLFFEKYRFIDYAIVGQGEVPLLKLTEHIQGKLSIDKVPSLWHREQGKIVSNSRIFYDIEDQSCPDFDGLSLELYRSQASIGEKALLIPYSASKGCLGRCTFCIHPQIGGSWQCKSVKKVVDDIVFLKQKYKSSCFSLKDSTFNASIKYLDDLCGEIIRRGLDIQWDAMVRSNNINQEILFKLEKAGCRNLMWGIESGSNRALKMMNKDADAREHAKILKMSKNAGISNTIYIMILYPYETSQDLEQTAVLIKDNAQLIDDLNIFILQILNGSYLYNNQEALKIKTKKNMLSPFYYWHDYDNTEEAISKYHKREVIKSRNALLGHGFRYVKYRYFRFPFNIIIRYLGPIFPRELHIIERAWNSNRFRLIHRRGRVRSFLR